jgi:DNA-binding CsgD family transcriptional regulator
MMPPQKLLDETISALYEAATNGALWPDALSSLSRVFDSPRVAIVRATPQLDGIFEIHQINHDPAAQKLYQDYYWALDPTLAMTRDAEQQVWYDCERLLHPSTTPEPEYAEFAIQHGIRYVAGGKVHSGATSIIAFSLQRPADHRRFGDAEIGAFQQLGAHIGRAASLSVDLRQAQLSKCISLAALNALDWPVYAVTSTGKLLLANRKGEMQLSLGVPFSVHGGKLHASWPQADLDLQKALLVAANRQASAFRVTQNSGSWWVRAVPVADCSGVTILYAARASGQKPSPALLRKVLGFSVAEADIACLLADGHHIKEIARARGVSVWTVRSQVRGIMQKAGVRRQVDLSQMLMSLPPLRDQTEGGDG